MIKYLILNNKEYRDLTKKIARGAGQTTPMTDEDNCAPAGPGRCGMGPAGMHDVRGKVTSPDQVFVMKTYLKMK